MAMTLVSTVTVGSGGAASIIFTGIPQTGKDLLLLISAKSDQNGSINIQINGDTGSNYTYRYLRGSGSAVLSASATTTNLDLDNQTAINGANIFSNTQVYFANYALTTQNKSISSDSVTEDNATTAWQLINAARWANNNAITSISISRVNFNLVQHSSASLYIVS
jgi:hypothetical protein